MDFDYTPTQGQLRREVAAFFSDEVSDDSAWGGAGGAFSRLRFEQLAAALRLPGLAVPEAWGGRGGDPLTAIIALEAFGHACDDAALVTAVCDHLLTGTIPISIFGTDEQRAAILPELLAGKRLAVDLLAQPGAGEIETVATPDGDGYLLDGSKPLVSNGMAGDVGLVAAATEPSADPGEKISVFLVDLHLPGIARHELPRDSGGRGVSACEIRFENVRLPASSVLGGAAAIGTGRELYLRAIGWKHIGWYAAQVGTMQRLTEAAIKCARARKRSGRCRGDEQADAQRIVDMKIRLETARLLTYRAASSLGGARGVALDAAMVKLFVGDGLVETALDHVHIHGAAGNAGSLCEALGSAFDSGSSASQRRIIAGQLGL